ncbi:MAG TPA: A/G-specific adenine glycosylase [Bacteroidia bacterium]|nr:A/G-specific adenine glycosylase [Bacteroidia bacterium]
MDFVAELLNWYRKNKRNLPWRGTKDPYKVWLSEIILQQTRVEQGTAYYHAFVENYPDVQSLAAATEDHVLKTWQGLGYYSRARNLHATARIIAGEMSGKFPGDHAGLLKLKGIGDYTASAISSICFNEAQPVVDGNVYRFLSRYFGIQTPIDSTAGKKEFREIAAELIPAKDPGTFNQAMMEFGARQCTPRNPDCSVCVFRLSCVALKKKLVTRLPIKGNKTKVSNRYFYYLILKNGKNTFIRQRTGKDIWQGLHDFPLIESVAVLEEKQVVKISSWKKIVGNIPVKITGISEEHIHLLSHRKLHVRFIFAEVKGKVVLPEEYRKVAISELEKFAFPILLAKNLKELFSRE